MLICTKYFHATKCNTTKTRSTITGKPCAAAAEVLRLDSDPYEVNDDGCEALCEAASDGCIHGSAERRPLREEEEEEE